MLCTFRYDEHVALAQRDGGLAAVSIADCHIELAVEDQKELVGVFVYVPHVLALGVGHANLVIVHAGDDPRTVRLVE